jgi:methyl-accepting chemotaxis protein
MRFFADLPIRAKVVGGFLSVLLILLAVTLFGYVRLGAIVDAFDRSATGAADAGAISKIERDFVAMRLSGRDYSDNGRPETAVTLREQGSQLRAEINERAAKTRDPTMRTLVDSFAEYAKDTDKAITLRQAQDKLAIETLRPLGVQATKALDNLIEAAEQAHPATSVAARHVLRQFMQLRIDLSHILEGNDPTSAQEADEATGRLREALTTLSAAGGNETFANHIKAVGELILPYLDAFQQIRTINTDLLAVGGKLMPPIAGQISDAATAMVQSSLAERSRIEAESTDSAKQAQMLMAVGGSVGLLLGIVLGMLISQSIAHPITAITGCMQRLAAGDLGVVVPADGHRDEVGQMALAVGVFRDNARRIQAMEQERVRETERLATARSSEMAALADGFEAKVGGMASELASEARELRGTAETMAATAAQTRTQAEAVNAAADGASSGVQTVAAAAEELAASIGEIGRQVAQSARISDQAVANARRTDETVRALADGAKRIGDVVGLISSIAAQTNLLALNATIEAARAGDAGKGFAVVASEVKSLASQTAKATEEIGTQIHQIQHSTQEAVQAIRSITEVIEEVSAIATSIASAVEQQGASTADIARNVSQTARGTQEVSSTIGEVSRAAEQTGTTAGEVLKAAGLLAGQAGDLAGAVKHFVATVRAA